MTEIKFGQRRVLKNSKKKMYKIFVFLVCLIITSSAYASSELKKLSKHLKNGELVKIQTYEAFSFYSLQEGWYKNTNSEFDALISYPKGKGPFPMVIIAHSSWGPEEFTSKWMKFHKDLSPEYQKGYHKLFLPLVKISQTNKIVKKMSLIK